MGGGELQTFIEAKFMKKNNFHIFNHPKFSGKMQNRDSN